MSHNNNNNNNNHSKRHSSLYMLPLSNINSHDSIESNDIDHITLNQESEDYDANVGEEDNPYLISISKDSNINNNQSINTFTPHNTPRDSDNNHIDIDILNNKLTALARITSVNSGSYLSDYHSLTPLSKDPSATSLYQFNSNTSSSGNNSKQVSNVNLKKMMALTAHNNNNNINNSNSTTNTKYRLSGSNSGTKLQSSFADLMGFNNINSSSFNNFNNINNSSFKNSSDANPYSYRNRNKVKLSLVNSRESEDDDEEEEEEEDIDERLKLSNYRDTRSDSDNRSTNISQQLTFDLNNQEQHTQSDNESNFSMVSSLEAKSPKSPYMHTSFNPSTSAPTVVAQKPKLSPIHSHQTTPQLKPKEKVKYVFILSGLPASGKSTLSQNMIQYMTNTYLTSANNNEEEEEEDKEDTPVQIKEYENGISIDNKNKNNNNINSGNKKRSPRKRRSSLFGDGDDPKRLNIEIFNAGKIRRSDSYNRTKKMYLMANNSNDDLFSPKNKSKKDVFAKLTLDSLFKSLRGGKGLDMAIFDATNSTRERRRFVIEEIAKQQRELTKEMKQKQQMNMSDDEEGEGEGEENVELKIVPVFLQIMCTNKEFIRYNIYNKSFNDDYYDKPFDFAIKDFSKRVLYYSQQYCPITQEEVNDLEKLMHENGSHSDLYYINLENSSDSSYESNISENATEKDGILSGLLDFAKKYNSLPESIAYVKQVGRLLDTIDGWNLGVLEANLNDEYFDKLNRNLQRTCNKYGVKVPLIK